MAGKPGRSGGANRKSLATHLAQGTYRSDKHGPLTAVPPVAHASLAARRRALGGLSGVARHTVGTLLNEFGDWDTAGLSTLRAYGLSCARLEVLQAAPGDDTAELHRETRTNLSLLKALDLGGGR